MPLLTLAERLEDTPGAMVKNAAPLPWGCVKGTFANRNALVVATTIATGTGRHAAPHVLQGVAIFVKPLVGEEQHMLSAMVSLK
jgi:hypothetical protein